MLDISLAIEGVGTLCTALESFFLVEKAGDLLESQVTFEKCKEKGSMEKKEKTRFLCLEDQRHWSVSIGAGLAAFPQLPEPRPQRKLVSA